MEKYIKVPKGATVKWKVSCDGYENQEGVQTLMDDITLNIDLELLMGTVDVTNYEYTLENDTVTLTKYIGSDTTETMPGIER